MANTVVIALTGKGGVGKTSLCAAISSSEAKQAQS